MTGYHDVNNPLGEVNCRGSWTLHNNCKVCPRCIGSKESRDKFATPVAPAIPDTGSPTDTAPKLTGGSSAYYMADLLDGRQIECFDLIEALGLNFAEGNILKALWRRAKARMGGGKPGTSSLYDAEKLVFMAKRELDRERLSGLHRDTMLRFPKTMAQLAD